MEQSLDNGCGVNIAYTNKELLNMGYSYSFDTGEGHSLVTQGIGNLKIEVSKRKIRTKGSIYLIFPDGFKFVEDYQYNPNIKLMD